MCRQHQVRVYPLSFEAILLKEYSERSEGHRCSVSSSLLVEHKSKVDYWLNDLSTLFIQNIVRPNRSRRTSISYGCCMLDWCLRPIHSWTTADLPFVFFFHSLVFSSSLSLSLSPLHSIYVRYNAKYVTWFESEKVRTHLPTHVYMNRFYSLIPPLSLSLSLFISKIDALIQTKTIIIILQWIIAIACWS